MNANSRQELVKNILRRLTINRIAMSEDYHAKLGVSLRFQKSNKKHTRKFVGSIKRSARIAISYTISIQTRSITVKLL
jgi:hypothetical protein